jgi:hypothetical protein
MFLVHRRHVVEPVEVGQRLQVRFVFDQFLGSTVEQSDMRIDALNDLAVEFEHEAQNAVGRRVLGPEIDGEIADSRFGHTDLMSLQVCNAPPFLLVPSDADQHA